DTWAYTYTIDLTAFILPANGLETVSNLADAVEPTPPTVTDNCGNTMVPVLSDTSTTPDCQGSKIYTFTYTDCAGNSADWTYTYTIILAPFTVPADGASTVNCIADATETFTLPTIQDVNGNILTPSAAVITDTPDPLTCEGTRTYTYTYTDCAGNSDDWSYVYTIDTPAFTITDPDGASTVNCIADATETFTMPTI
ncbi:HYR-like domain-containing protein, partial [Yeosuana marina]|uniref:HYR-like domain-containing protein n=1 Tax=Yeosuana marina TaxID=1565536 RepID=UPI0019D16BFC